jgi:hypothetical protein
MDIYQKKYLKYKTKYLDLLNQRGGGNIDYFIKNIDKYQEIGKGAQGIVYSNISDYDSVFKVSNNTNTCRIWNGESKIYEILNKINIDTELCKLIKMNEYIHIENKMCIMKLLRVINPINQDLKYTIHPQFQHEKLDYTVKGRGRFLGINDLISKEIFTLDNIQNYIKDLGILMSRLHYLLKNDGYDIEIFIGKDIETNIVLYVGDFDLSEFYETINDEIIERLEWSLSAVPYFPIQGEYYEIFSQNYLEEASKYNMRETAKKVLKLYTENIQLNE